MLIIVNRDIPTSAKENLTASVRSHHPDVVLLELETEGIVPPFISGFPCMFFCPLPDKLVVSPELPEKYVQLLKEHRVKFIQPETSDQKPETGSYNAIATGEYLIHHLPLTDPAILQNCHYLKKIPVKQGFTRSHLIPLRDHHFITSDKGIETALRERGLDVLLVSENEILLPGHLNGGIGGAAGISGDAVFLTGSLSFHPEGEKIRNYLEILHYRILELDRAPLMDYGGILFV